MEINLREKLWAYIVVHNPELMFELQEGFSVTRYLSEKVKGVMPKVHQLLAEEKALHVIEELCLNELTMALKPSRFLYIKEVLLEEFPETYQMMQEKGCLTYEAAKMASTCSETFESFGFNEENKNDRLLRHAVIAKLHACLN